MPPHLRASYEGMKDFGLFEDSYIQTLKGRQARAVWWGVAAAFVISLFVLV